MIAVQLDMPNLSPAILMEFLTVKCDVKTRYTRETEK
jgi:hypothetical protein